MSRKTRKLIWSAPLLAAFAVVGALALFVALSPNLAQAHDVPGVPTDLSAMPAPDDPNTPAVEGRTQIKLTWKAPTGADMGITGYRIDRSEGDDGHVWMKLVENTGTPDVLEYTDPVKGSASGSTYFYRVFAVNTTGVGPMSVVEDGTTLPLEKPDAPSPVMATANGATEIVVKWKPPADDGGSTVTKYRIIWDPPGTDSFPDATEITAGTRTVEGDVCEFSASGGYLEYRHKKLTANQEFRYRVYAINDVDTSEGSAIRNATTGPKEQPDPPTDVLAVQVDATTTQLFWNWPASDGGAAITGFRVEVTERSGQWPARDSDAPEATGAATSAPDLTAGDATADDATDDIFNGAFTVLAAGVETNAQEVTHTHGYNTTADPATGKGTTLYYRVFTITGTDEDGRSRSAGSSSVKLVGDGADTDTLIDLPPPLGTVTVAPPAIAADKHGNYSKLILNWVSPSDNPTSYRIDYSSDGIKWNRLEPDTRLAKPGEYTDAELKPATGRHYRVFAKRGGKFRPAVKSGTPEPAAAAGGAGRTGNAIAPSNVQNITATARGADMIELRWEQPMYDGGADITHYQVQQRSPDSNTWSHAAWLEVKRDPDSCMLEPIGTWTDKDLVAETTMYYRVYAVNSASVNTNDAAVDVTATPVVSVDTPDGEADPETDHATTAAAKKPDAPIGLSAELAKDSRLKGAGQQGVLILWNAPEKPPGSPVTGYRIERKVMGEDNNEWMELEASSSASQTHYTDRDEPADGEMRYYRVAALNRLANDTEGMSDWSNEAEIPVGEHTHTPSMPTNLMANATSDTEVMVTWDAPANDGGSAITGYTVGYRVDGADHSTNMEMEVTGTSATISGLMADTTYAFWVWATNANGDSDITGPAKATTEMGPAELTAPTNVKATVSREDGDPGNPANVTVTWTNGQGAVSHVAGLLQGSTLVYFASGQTDGTTTISNVAPGTYLVGVAAFDDDFNLEIGVSDMPLTVQ